MSYEPPQNDALNFAGSTYTAPAVDALDFEAQVITRTTFRWAARGQRRITYIDITETPRGQRRSFGEFFEVAGRGTRHVRNDFTEAPRGDRRVVYIDVAERARGSRQLRATFSEWAGRGQRRIFNTFREQPTGRRRAVYALFEEAARGTRHVLGVFVEEAGRGLRRLADATATTYQLYVGEGQDPDTSGTPDATSESKEFTHALAAASAGQTVIYHLVTLARNRWGLRWQVGPVTKLTLDDQGAEVTPAPTAPTFTATALEDGRVRIEASYPWQGDDVDQRADQWRLWAELGSDPVSGTDTPIETLDQLHALQVEELVHDTDAFADGADVRVLVRVRRSSDGVESTNTATVQVTATNQGAPIDRGDGFLGRKRRQG